MRAENGKKNRIFGGLIWTFGERVSAQLVSAIVGIILARLLMPEDYGVISIVLVFITFCDVFVTSGLGTAIVQKQKASQEDYNTAFTMSLIMAVIRYVVLYVSAPRIAHFYSMPILKPVIRVLGIRVIITAINTIQHAIIQREMAFRKFFFATLIGTLISCAVGIVMAYSGFGVWALVAQYLTNTVIDTSVLSFVNKWKPKIILSKESAGHIISFGGKILITNIILNLVGEVRSLIVGKVFGPAELAYYDQGRKYPKLVIDNVDSAIQEVMLPTFSRVQDNISELKSILRKSISVSIYVMAPLLLGLLAVADTFVSAILTEKWDFAIPFVRIFCLMFISWPLTSSCHQALLAIGKSNLVLWILLTSSSAQLILDLIAVFVFRNLLLAAVFAVVASFVSVIGFEIAMNRLADYKSAEQIKDVLPSLLISSVMCISVYLMHTIQINKVLLLIVQILTGAAVYVSLSVLFKLEPYIYLRNLLKEKLLNKNIPAD